MGISGKNTLELIITAKNRARKAFSDITKQMHGVKKSAGGINGAMNAVQTSISRVSPAAGQLVKALGPLGLAGVAVLATAAIVGMGAAAVKSFTAFEDAMANVRKTTGMTKEQIKVLGDAIDQMAMSIPVAHEELAGIAAIAGQLGIQGKSNILGFTEDVAKMSTAFDMSAESAATAMAKMSNIYGIPIEQVSALGSAINVLGNTTAAQESAIMDFSMSLGAAGRQLGFGATESVAMGATLISMGMDASAAGTRLNAAFTKMAKNVDKVSKFLGVTEEEFRAAFGEDPMGMITQITAKLAEIEDPLERNAAAAEFFGQIGAKAINGLGGDLEGLQTNLANAATGFTENTSLTEEFAAKTDTLKAKFALVGNAVESFKINIGEALAPLAGALAEGAINAVKGLSDGFSALQKVVGSILGIFKPFFDAIRSAVGSALKPLFDIIKNVSAEFNKTTTITKLFSDVVIILTAGAKWLGEALGTLLSKALTPLVSKIKEAIAMLTAFYDNLGPIKGLVEGVKGAVGGAVDGIGEWANSLKEAEPPAEKLTEAIEELEETAETIGPAMLESAKTLSSPLEEASGSYKTAIANISKEIESLKDAWNLASKEEKAAVEDQIGALEGIKTELEKGEKAQTDYFDTAINGAEKASEKQKEFSVQIGETTITFKDMAAEVVKNANAYEDLQKNAETLLNLDWSVFKTLESELPNIDTGIKDMSSAFVGLKDVLEDNIVELENVKTSVMEISEIAAPFLEAGFLDGIKSIGSFAGALSDAGSAINTFGSLQEVSIDGCIDFSLHVHDMVSALELLEGQMEDLVPSFADMDSLITDIADAFVYSSGKGEAMADKVSTAFGNIDNRAKEYNTTFDELLETYKKGDKSWESLYDVIDIFGGTFRDMEWIMADWNAEINNSTGNLLNLTEMFDLASMSGKERTEWLEKEMHTNVALTKHMDTQTNALKAQTGQLSKITDALQPYLEFMRTLNELAALSTLSTADLNNGLNAINNTLVNLGTSLETFDLRPVMETLFGAKMEEGEFASGLATDFIDTMQDFATPFSSLITYVDRLSSSIFSLVSSFKALADINDSVLADQEKLKEVFEGITDVLSNFTLSMGGKAGEWGFAQKIADGMEEMLRSTVPLIKYFQDNNAAIEQFNKSLSSFRDTIGNIIGVFKDLSSFVEASSKLVVVSAGEIEKALSLVDDQLKEIVLYLKSDAWSEIVKQLSAVSDEYTTHKKVLEETMPAFNDAITTISTLTSSVVSLSEGFKELNETTLISSIDMERAMGRINTFIIRFTDALRTNLSSLVSSLKDLDAQWSIHAKDMEKVMPSYKSATDNTGTLLGTLSSLTSALKALSETGSISATTFNKGFSATIKSIRNFAVSLEKYVEPLIISLQTLRKVWVENEEVLVPLMRDLISITNSFRSVAVNVNNMIEAFRTLSKGSIVLKLGFKRLIDFIIEVTKQTKEFYTPEAAKKIAQYVIDVGFVVRAFQILSGELSKATSGIERKITESVNNVSSKIQSLKTLIPNMFVYGSALMFSFISGINAWKGVLIATMESIANIIKAYLGVSSPTELGPLRDLEKWPRNLVKSFSEGVKTEMGMINASFSGMSAPISSGGGSRTSVVFNVTQNISDKATADYSNRELERMLNKHQVM